MSNKGRCRICGKTYVSSGMSRHLLSCIDKETMTDGIPERLEKLYEIAPTIESVDEIQDENEKKITGCLLR